MDLTTPDLKLSAFLASLDFDIEYFYKIVKKNIETKKEKYAYEIRFKDFSKTGQSIKQAVKSYHMPTQDTHLDAGKLCYVIGNNINAVRAKRELYIKEFANYKLLSSEPASGYCFIEAPCTDDFAIQCAINGKDVSLIKDNACADDSPLSIAAQYVKNLQFLETCPKREKLLISYNGKTAYLPKDASEEAKAKALKHLNT